MNEKCGHTIEDLLFELLHTASKLTLMKVDESLEQTGISGVKVWALSLLLNQADTLGIGQLAEAMQCGKSNATQIVDRMEAESLVKRLPHPDDRRSILVEVTAEGEARYIAGLETRRAAVKDILTAFSAEEQAQFVALLQKLVETLSG